MVVLRGISWLIRERDWVGKISMRDVMGIKKAQAIIRPLQRQDKGGSGEIEGVIFRADWF